MRTTKTRCRRPSQPASSHFLHSVRSHSLIFLSVSAHSPSIADGSMFLKSSPSVGIAGALMQTGKEGVANCGAPIRIVLFADLLPAFQLSCPNEVKDPLILWRDDLLDNDRRRNASTPLLKDRLRIWPTKSSLSGLIFPKSRSRPLHDSLWNTLLAASPKRRSIAGTKTCGHDATHNKS